MDLEDFAKLMNFAELAEIMEKKFELMEKRVPAPQPTPIYKLSMASMIWNISIVQLGLAVWLCSLPSLVQLLISQIREAEKCP